MRRERPEIGKLCAGCALINGMIVDDELRDGALARCAICVGIIPDLSNLEQI
jgi:hypothetical protein